MMEMMQPMMMVVMPLVMPKMMGFMSTMMPNMHLMMPKMMEETMIPMIQENPAVGEHMMTMMQTMFPHCAMNMFPLIDKQQRIEFITKLYGIMARSGTLEMVDNEKQAFHSNSSETLKQAIESSD